jgi:superfamily II DNA or RNA helicase
MKTLYPKQQEAHDFFVSCLTKNVNTLDSSDVGTGKTIVACHIAKTLGKPFFVMCPKAVIPSWEREAAACGLKPLFVMNYEKLRTGKTPWLTKRGKKIFNWKLPEGAIGFIDECHKAGNPYTQNAQMVIALHKEDFRIHLMSATSANDPTEMRAIGYALGLHSLNEAQAPLKSWYRWMMDYGCVQNTWGAWELRKKNKLSLLHDQIYNRNAKRLTVADFPDSFRKNRIFVENIQFSNLSKIHAAYKSLNITPEIIERYIELGTVEDSEHTLVNLLRARQLAESFKVNDIAEMVDELLLEEASVVVFMNFRETAEALALTLRCEKIVGGQSAADRQRIIDDFQSDKTHVLVVNIAAGGTGISLHDLNGDRPRVSLICPTFNDKDYMQALGRIHRNGAKSDAVQKILVANGTVEEVVIKSIQNKIANHDMLHGTK